MSKSLADRVRLPRPTAVLMAILAISVLVRLAVAFYLGDVVDAPSLLTDQRSYHALGRRLVSGHGFSFATHWYPFTPPDTPTAHWSFLYSLYTAAIYALFGPHPLAARLAGAVLGGLLLPLLVYRLSLRLFPSRQPVALVAAACAALYGYFVLYAATIMTETLFVVVVLWSLERAIALAGRPSWARALLLGLSLGLAALLRQSILPWVLPLAAWLLWAAWQKHRLRAIAGSLVLVALVIVAMILPFTIRNTRAFGEFLLLNSNAGYALYVSQHPFQGTSFQEFATAPIPADLRGLNEAQLDRRLLRRGISFIVADPGRYLLLSLSRVRDYFEFWPSPDTTLLHNIGRTGSFGLFLPFMLAGIWIALRRAAPSPAGDSWACFLASPLALVLLFVVVYSLMHIFTWAMPRYRLPVDAAALPFAALALVEFWNWLSRRFRLPASN